MKRLSFPVVGLWAVLAASVLVVSPLGCKKSETAPDAPTATDKPAAPATGPVARVNGVDLSRAEFDRQMERTRARFQRAGRPVAASLETRLKENLIRKMVEETLIGQRAMSEGVTVAPEELAAKLAEHKNRFGSDKAFQSFLERTGQTEADVQIDLERNLLRDKLFTRLLQSTEPTEADAKTHYTENLDKYRQKEQIKASHILIKVEKDTTETEKAEKLALAKKVLAEAKKGGDFAALARQHSDGPTKERGGDLGTFSRNRMVKPFEDAAFAAKAGEIVGPVETQFGFHVIKVEEKFPETQRPFDEVKDSILTSLRARQKSKATRELLENLRKEAKIELLEPGIDLDPRRTALTGDGRELPGAKQDGQGPSDDGADSAQDGAGDKD
jgi:peptidyl-prolyl cis-trans isomerase C